MCVVTVTVSKLSHADPPLWPNLASVLPFFLQNHEIRKVTATSASCISCNTSNTAGMDWERWGRGGGRIPWVGFYFLAFLPHSTRVSNLPRNLKITHVADVIFEINQIQTRESIQREDGSICKIPMRWLDLSPLSTSTRGTGTGGGRRAPWKREGGWEYIWAKALLLFLYLWRDPGNQGPSRTYLSHVLHRTKVRSSWCNSTKALEIHKGSCNTHSVHSGWGRCVIKRAELIVRKLGRKFGDFED